MSTKLAVCVWSIFLCGSVAVAEVCPQYALRDKEIVRSQLTSQSSGVMGALTRMTNIAYIASGTSAILSSSPFQRQQRAALDGEYQAWITYIDEFANNITALIKPRTRHFLRQFVNSTYLGLNGTRINGTDDEDAGRNADMAVNKLGAAMERLWRCF